MAVLRDVAKHAKVSITTASMVLTGQAKSCRIAPATEDRVFAAAKSLNYRPSYQKRMVRRGRADVVGFVMSFADRRDLGGAFWHAIQEGAETRARIAGLDVLLVSGRSHAEAFRRTRNYYRENRIDAAVVPGHFVSLLEDPIDMPLVLLLTEPHEVPWPSVVLDAKPGIDETIAHLRELGHRELLWVHEAPPFEAMRERGLMVEAAAGRAGMAFHALGLDIGVKGEPAKGVPLETYNAACHGVAMANIAELQRHTAVFCYNDRLALGVMAALQRAGKRIPEDVSLVGFDDLQGVNTIPRLTSVSHRLDDIGAAAVELALRMVDHPEQMPNLRGSVKTLTARLVVGKSTAKPQLKRAHQTKTQPA